MGNSSSSKNASSNQSAASSKYEDPEAKLELANKSVCEIFYNTYSEADRLKAGALKLYSSTGVAISFTDDNGTVHYGIVTPNLSIDWEPDPKSFELYIDYDGLRVQSKFPSVKLDCTFTCPVLNITLIRLQDEIVELLKGQGCFFHDLRQEKTVDKYTTICVLDGKRDKSVYSKLNYCRFEEYYGHDLVYNYERNPSEKYPNPPNPGEPIVTLLSGQLVGIHKESQHDDKEFIGISTKTISNVFQQLIKNTPITHFVSNPLDTSGYEGKLEENGLEIMPCTDSDRYKNCTMYISPASPLITPIWFMPTYLGWYWTPTDPNGPVYPNWMSVDRLEVIGGDWHGDIPAPKNITIIRWLDQHNIDTVIFPSSNN